MKLLYLDNLRGFSGSVIPISDVTFLVGENSTGKSTVLSVLHMFLQGGWIFDLDFDSEDYHMGGFDDLVSASSSNKKSFTIGLTRELRGHRDGITFGCFFVSFISDDGFPLMNKFSYLAGQVLVTIKFEDNKVSYGVERAHDVINNPKEMINKSQMEILAKIHAEADAEKFETLEAPSGAMRDRYYMLFLIAREMAEKTKEREREYSTDPLQYIQGVSPSAWIAPIRAKPKRTYDASKGKYDAEGSHTPYLIRQHLKAGGSREHRRMLFNGFGKDGNLFDGIKIRPFGAGAYGPFEVQVELGRNQHSIANVGYGVSQALPIVVEGIVRDPGTQLFIQQPEVHLHPRAQASLGSLLWKLASAERKGVIVETHSDFLIDRFRRELADADCSVEASVLFFERKSKGNKVSEILIGNDGRYSEDQPTGFREFFIDEQMSMLDL